MDAQENAKENTPEAKPQRKVFGRRKGRPLHAHKAQLIAEFLPRVRLEIPATGTLAVPARLWVEIGFGGGEHLAAQAALHPDVAFIGCEPFLNGVASLCGHLEAGKIDNVRVYGDDARHVLDALPEAAVERCFVLFADPWPKKRHAERRFIGVENLPRLARVLKPGGLLRLASDDAQLVAWMRERVAECPAFEKLHDSPTPPEGWVPTRYQEKAVRAGRVPVFLDYRRV